MRTLDTKEIIEYQVPHIYPIKILQLLKEGGASQYPISQGGNWALGKKVHGLAGSHNCLVIEED